MDKRKKKRKLITYGITGVPLFDRSTVTLVIQILTKIKEINSLYSTEEIGVVLGMEWESLLTKKNNLYA